MRFIIIITIILQGCVTASFDYIHERAREANGMNFCYYLSDGSVKEHFCIKKTVKPKIEFLVDF